MFCQVWKSFRCWGVSSALIVTRYRSRPSADWPKTLTSIRPLLRACMSARVQAKAYQGICGKLPTGSPGLLPSGSDPVASGIGVPHHGGAIEALLATGNSDLAATGVASAPMGEIKIEAVKRNETKRASRDTLLR